MMDTKFVQSLSLENRLALQGPIGLNGRRIQNLGMVDIQQLTDPIKMAEDENCYVEVIFYTNNEPHIHVHVKKWSKSALKAIKEGLKDIKLFFYNKGYDNLFTTYVENIDRKHKKFVKMLGFKPELIYEYPNKLRVIKARSPLNGN